MVLAQRAHLPVEVGRCRVVAGQALAATDPQRAVDELARAHEELAAQGATRYRDQAAQRLGELEGAVPPAANTDDALATLSRREREVAELVAQGHTNKAIGAQLGLSPSTINNHLVRVFARLGINSRGELAALWHHSRHP
jgi:DNA-binding NarL/FixJ family response regulator